ncbi:MAG: cupin domain-containing protein, partial [Gemmatimonadaceae bacterium]
TIPSEQWIEKVSGDMNMPGLPFVIRIHHDAGYVVLPHTHPEDENITVLTGSWALGMGPRLKMSELKPMEPGAFGFVPKTMEHFGYAKVETILQVQGIGPFVNVPIDPVYELTDKGVLFKPSLVKPGVRSSFSPPDCFTLKIGAHVRGARGEGMIVGALCSTANQFTQYWVQQPNRGRFWATLQDLKPL